MSRIRDVTFMIKILSPFLLMSLLLTLSIPAHAQDRQQMRQVIEQKTNRLEVDKSNFENDQPDTANQSDLETNSLGISLEEKMRVETQNRGDDFQLRVATENLQRLQEMEVGDDELDDQLKNIAEEQARSQIKVQAEVAKLRAKSSFIKKFLGTDQAAIKSLQQQKIENQERISQLETLSPELRSSVDKTEVEKLTQSLVEQNNDLEAKIQTEAKQKGVLGWLKRLFSRDAS